jgi:hypothetical protein
MANTTDEAPRRRGRPRGSRNKAARPSMEPFGRWRAERARLERYIAIGNFVQVAGWQHQELGARTLVHPQQPRIVERLLPDDELTLFSF